MTLSSLGCEFPIFYGQCLRRVRYPTLDDVMVILRGLRRAYPKDLIRVMNRGAIESTLYAVRYAGNELRSFRARVSAKAATLLYLMVMNHPLIDGNKRFASILTRYFLILNGYDIDRVLLMRLSLEVAGGSIDPKSLYRVFYQHIIRVGD